MIARRILVALLALAATLGITGPADASATYWKNSTVSVTYVTVQLYNNGWFYRDVQPGYAAGSSTVKVYYYKLTGGFCSQEYDAVTGTTLRKRTGSNTYPWVSVPGNELVYVFHC